MKKLFDGVLQGMGFIVVVAVAFAIAWAGDVLTVDKDGTPKFVVNDQGKITVGATESYVNLVIQNDEVAAEADNKVDITADVLTVEGVRLENVNVSTNIESGGAGGLDTGAEAGSTWYYVWIITNNVGASTNGLLSISSTSPTLPLGFTKKRRVGSVRNDGSSNFLQFVQEGNKCNYLDGVLTCRILNGGIDTNWTVIPQATISPYIPATSKRAFIKLQMQVSQAAAGGSFVGRIRKAGSTGANGQCTAYLVTQIDGRTVTEQTTVDVDLSASREFEYMISATPNSGGVFIDIIGYYDRI